MTEIIDGIRHLITPVTAEDISALHIGDMFYLSGSMTTCRDVAHRRVVEEKMQLPADVADEDGAFNSVGYYEGQKMGITPALYDRDKGIYHVEPHHALVRQDCTPNDEKIRIFNYAFP